MSTIAAISTGQAPGGIGVIRISGPRAREIAGRVFVPRYGRSIIDMLGYTAALGDVLDEDGARLDECVALVFSGPKSYTGEDVVELSCHGGLFVTRQVLARVISAGAEPAGPGEFTKRAFLNGKLDLAQAEAVMELIGARGREAMRMASAGENGALSRRIGGICGKLEELGAHLAAWADFPEEDVEEIEPEGLCRTLEDCISQLDALLLGFERGKVYREGLRTVIAGKPNVGKSTLMNLLAGHERSIVTPYAGTTRDVVEETVSLGGIPLFLADTAGIRVTEDPIEEMGVSAARSRLSTAQLVLAVFDVSRELDKEDIELMNSLPDIPAIAVLNKNDLEQCMDTRPILERFRQVVELSASSGEGLGTLSKALEALMSVEGFDSAGGELFTDRQRAAAQSCRGALAQALDAINGGMTLDAVTVCVESGLGSLYELTGRRVSEEIADRVFENFCVGK